MPARTHTNTQSDSPSLQVLSWAHSSASHLFPCSPLFPLFPDCTPSCPGLASGELLQPGRRLVFWALLFFSSPTLLLSSSWVFPSVLVLANYRSILPLPTVCCCCRAPPYLPPSLPPSPPPPLVCFTLPPQSEWVEEGGGGEGRGTDVY